MGIIILVVVGVLLLWGILMYNSLVKGRLQVDDAWSDIDTLLKRRYDLIPNLIETVKGYAKHEKELFEAVTESRAKAMKAEQQGDVKAAGAAETALSGALMNIAAVAENYPELKADQNFAKLQDELSDTENKIQASRRFYNATVRDFNIKVQSVPTNIVANLFKFENREFFELEDEAQRENPQVSF